MLIHKTKKKNKRKQSELVFYIKDIVRANDIVKFSQLSYFADAFCGLHVEVGVNMLFAKCVLLLKNKTMIFTDLGTITFQTRFSGKISKYFGI